jgi:hypothetical protein
VNITIKAIETVYRGYRFRSRLEARWAVFFDAAGIKWEYEVQGFEINGRRYLPDFWLPRLKTYVEVKPTEEEAEKAKPLMQALAQGSSYCAQIMIGAPEYENPPSVLHYSPQGASRRCYWGECQFCGRVLAHPVCWCAPDGVEMMKRPPQSIRHRVQHAMDEAQGARFEHGEDGQPEPYCAYAPARAVHVCAVGVVVAQPGRFRVVSCFQAEAAAPDVILRQVAASEVLFAWVDRANIARRVAEIDAARAKNIPIFVAFKNEPSRQFYSVSQLADVAMVAPSVQVAWEMFTRWRDMEDEDAWTFLTGRR